MQNSPLNYLPTLFVISIISLLFCVLITESVKNDGKTYINYNETCDIIGRTRAFCPSEKSAIGQKVSFEKFDYVAEVKCDASDSNAINYLNFFPNMGRISQLVIMKCSALNELTNIAQLFRNSKISTLHIYNDFGVKLTADFFRDLERLTDLEVRKSNLTTLEPDCFQHLNSLESITLSKCKLTDVPASIFNATKKLNHLEMHHNRLQHLPESIFENLHLLLLLYLNNNELAALPDNIFRNTAALSTLDLSDNKLTSINEKLLATLTNLRFLVLSRNQLLSVHDNVFSNMPHLIELKLNNNSLNLQPTNDGFMFPPALKYLNLDLNWITSFNSTWFSACKTLSYINMSHNSIAHIQAENLVNLTNPKLILDLSHNSIHAMYLPQKFDNRTLLSNELLIYLSHNPWQCNCQSVDFLHFVKSNAKTIADLKEMRCNDTKFLKNFSELETIDICPPKQAFTTALVSLACMGALIGILLALYYKYHHKITIWLYARNMCLPCITETELDRGKIYDAFISFSNKDLQFIAEHLQPQLEHGARPFRLCIHTRDWLVGEVIADQIMLSIELSRRTIIVLSQNFITSSWSLMEFRAAHQAALNEGRVRVIIIMYGEVNDMEHLDPLLKSYLDMHTYLEWGDPWFWEKLRYAMPHPKRRGAEVRPNFDDIEMNRIH